MNESIPGLSPHLLTLLGQLGTVKTFSEGDSHCVAAIHPSRPTVGTIGAWTGGPAAREQAEHWLAAQGCTVARGPMLLCSWFDYRVNDGPFVEPPFLMEPTERPEPWVDADYVECAGYSSTLVPHEPILTATRPITNRLESEGWSIQSLPRGDDGLVPPEAYEEAVARIHAIAHEAFASAFGFCPLPLTAMQALYAPYRAAVDPDLVLIATAPDGTDAGFLFGMPDRALPQRGWAIIKTSAIRPEHAGKRVGTWINAEAHRRFRRKGYDRVVYALMWDESASRHWDRFDATPLRRYRLLEKSLPTPTQ